MQKTILFLTVLFLSASIKAQSVTDIIDNNDDSLTENLTSETVEKISGSRRILVLTNNNSSFDRGDFISLVFANELAVRGLVAKMDQQKAAFKITKIYSIPLWKSIRDGMEVKIIRGDDSYFNKKGDQDEVEELAGSGAIQSEEDLYNDTVILDEDNVTIDDKSDRVIQTDNVVALNFGRLTAQDTSGADASYTHPNLSWMYQIKDNIWGEALVGTNTISDYPTTGLEATLNTYTLRLKYAFETPFFTYTLPYLGYQIRDASSEGAGVDTGDGTTSTELANETALVDALNENKVVIGATILKRLVPGWFARLDVGMDIINLGLALEF